MTKTIYCNKCVGEIKYREDLVTTTSLFEVVPYHEDCYAKDLKGAKTLFINNQPINGFSGNFIAIAALIFGILLLIFAEGSAKWASILMLIPLGYRIYSYFYYERHLE